MREGQPTNRPTDQHTISLRIFLRLIQGHGDTQLHENIRSAFIDLKGGEILDKHVFLLFKFTDYTIEELLKCREF